MILSLAVLLFLSFIYFSVLTEVIQGPNTNESQHLHFIELDADWDTSKKEQFLENISKRYFDNNLIKSEFHSRDDSWRKLTASMALEFDSNPLNHVFEIHSTNIVQEDERALFIQDRSMVLRWEIVSMNSTSEELSVQGFNTILLPLILFTLFLYLNILFGAASSNLSSNKRVLESLILSGAHHSRLSSVFRKNGMSNFVLSLMIAILLYILTLYLFGINNGMDLNDISVSNAFKAIMIPSIILFGVHLIVLLWKVDKYIKSI